MATLLTTADAAKTALICHIANKTVEHVLNLQYGIECTSDLLSQIDKSSAYLWVLNSGCDISSEFLCKIIDYANAVTYTLDVCNPNVPCISDISSACGIIVADISNTDCFLPGNTINIIT